MMLFIIKLFHYHIITLITLILPLQSPFLNDIDKSTKKESHEHQYSPKTAPTQTPEINSIGIEKDHFHIKKHKENGYQKILDGHGLPCIAMTFDPAGKILQFVGGLPPGTQQMGHKNEEPDQSDNKKNLKAYGEITSRIGNVSYCLGKISLKKMKHSFPNGHAKISLVHQSLH
jgi:hypothetical protein